MTTGDIESNKGDDILDSSTAIESRIGRKRILDITSRHLVFVRVGRQFSPLRSAGLCSGEKTHYVFVEWKMGGGFHGRPMCISELRKQGARI